MKEGGKRGTGMTKDVLEQLESPMLEEMLMSTEKWPESQPVQLGIHDAARGRFGAFGSKASFGVVFLGPLASN